MPRQIFVNLPVRDLERAKAFFSNLGFSFNPQYTDDKAACMIIEDNSIYAMLLSEPFFKTFTPKALSDARSSTEVLVAISCDSKEQVDGMVAKARANGGKAVREPQDHGFMYQHAFEDPDGHIWELLHMRNAG